MKIPGYPDGPPDGLTVLAKARWWKHEGEWVLLVSPVWKVKPGHLVEAKRANGRVNRIPVGECLGNTGPNSDPKLDRKDILQPLGLSS